MNLFHSRRLSLAGIDRITGTLLALSVLVSCEKQPAPGGDDQPVAADHSEGDGHGHGEDSHADEVRLTADAIDRYGVKVETAQLWQLRPTFTAPARVSFNAEAMAHVGSPLRGRAVEIKVKLGTAVTAGDDLLVVESPELGEAQSDFLMKRAAAQAAAPAVDLARTFWDSAKKLHEKSEGVALVEVQKLEGEYKAAAAALKAAEAAAVAAENHLHLLGVNQAAAEALAVSGEVNPRFVIHAPIAGQVVEREVTLGELVSPDREALLVIADTGVLWVLANVPEARLHEVAVGAKAWVTIGTLGGNRFEGEVSFVSPLVDPTTRTAQVRIDVPASELPVRPGMFAQVEVVVTDPVQADPPPVVAVPAEAVQTVEGVAAVFVPVAGEENTFTHRAVLIGKSVGGLIPVYTGLVEGEQYVATGSFILKAELGKSTAEHVH